MNDEHASSSASSSFLSLILDLNPISWSSNSQGTSGKSPLSSLLPIILLFLNSHLALSHSNGVAVYLCSTRKRGKLVYSTAAHSLKGAGKATNGHDDVHNDASTYQYFGQLSRAVIKGIQDLVDEMASDDDQSDQNGQEQDEEEEETAIVKVLSMALNHLNRIVPSGSHSITGGSSSNSSNPLPPARSTDMSDGSNPSSTNLPFTAPNSRILILSTTASASNQYIGLMNCIFASQRRDIPIDVLKLYGDDTVFLQQASNLTGGIYFRLEQERKDGLLQLLLSTFLPTPALRKSLHLPNLDEVDFRASCFCHGEIVDVGYVCGVCLSIFCHPPRACHICSSPFPKRTLRKLQNDLTAPKGQQRQENGQE
ncbi:unnamed protein product [Sympodiomycopsis kandeliae]